MEFFRLTCGYTRPEAEEIIGYMDFPELITPTFPDPIDDFGVGLENKR